VAVSRNTRLLVLAGVVAAAAIVVVVVIVVAGGGSSSSAPPTTTAATGGGGGSTTPESTATFAGVPQHGDTLGKTTAPATMTVFEDPQCPFCREWNIDTLPTVVRDYVRTGRIRIVYRGIVVIGPNSVAGLRAAYAAGLQNKLWQMVESLYERQGQENSDWITIPVIRSAAREIGAVPARVVKDADSPAVTRQLNVAADEAQQLGVNGTPTFALQKQLGPIQQISPSGLAPAAFTSALDAALR
jgi:protein-disulfide isomerase